MGNDLSPRRRRVPVRIALFLVASLTIIVALETPVFSTPAVYQDTVSSQAKRTYTLYGDIDIQAGVGAMTSGPLRLVLRDETGGVVRSALVGNRYEYRFDQIPEGQYSLVLQAGVHELGQIQLAVRSAARSEIRQDLTVAHHGYEPPATSEAAFTTYGRSPASQVYWEAAGRLAEKGNWQGVRQQLLRVLDRDKTDFEAWTELGTAHFKLEAWDEAEAALLRATRARADYFRAWLNLGKVRFARGDYEGVIAALKEAVRLRHGSVESHYFLGESYLALRLGSKAVPHLEEALRLSPETMAGVHLRLAQLYHGAGLRKRAAEEYREYLSKKPRAKNRKAIQRYIREVQGSGSPR